MFRVLRHGTDRIGGEYVVNPTYKELELSDLDLVVASLAFYNTREEIDRLVSAIDEAKAIFG